MKCRRKNINTFKFDNYVFLLQGAKSGGELESAQGKNQALREAGAVVPTSYEGFETTIQQTFQKLVSISENMYFLQEETIPC